MADFYEFLLSLLAIPAPSGLEGGVRDALIKRLTPHVDRMVIDRAGNLVCEKHGKKRLPMPLLFAAHMDEVGFMVTEIREDGTLRFAPTGGVEAAILAGKRLIFPEKHLCGVIGIKPIHLMEKEEFEKGVRLKDLSIDVGAVDKKGAEALVSIGDLATFERAYHRPFFPGTRIAAPALDDRIGCALLAELLGGDTPEYDLTVAFTVKEESGTRGAIPLSFGIRPGIAVAVEATTASDLPKAEGADAVCFQGQGAVLSLADRGTLYDRALYEALINLAKRKNIPTQTKLRVAGGNDAHALQRAAGAVRVAAISAPCRYIHSPASTADKADIDSMRALIAASVKPLGDALISGGRS